MGPWFPLPPPLALSPAQAGASLRAGLVRSFLLDSEQRVPAKKCFCSSLSWPGVAETQSEEISWKGPENFPFLQEEIESQRTREGKHGSGVVQQDRVRAESGMCSPESFLQACWG